MLVKQTLKSDITAMLLELIQEENKDEAIEKFAEKLSEAIDKYVRQITVITYVYGTPVVAIIS